MNPAVSQTVVDETSFVAYETIREQRKYVGVADEFMDVFAIDNQLSILTVAEEDESRD